VSTHALRRRYVVGSTTGRGPCEACGLVAELHEVVEEARLPVLNPEWWRPLRILDLCLPCAYRARFARAPLQLAPAA
jgi:hypothetical protein